MAEAKINEKCIIGLPTCGYAFSSSRMAFIAAPSDDDFRLELDILKGLLEEKQYEAYIAVERVDPAKLAFCAKICSKIITSQFCLVLLNSSKHRSHPDILIPNPNVHLEYGLMLAFSKLVLPFQKEGDVLAFNIKPLDTILYTNSNFRQRAEEAIDGAILSAATTSRPSRALVSSEIVLKYMAVRGLKVADTISDEGNALYRLGSPMGYYLLDGEDIVYFGVFDLEPAKEVVFRLKLLLQSLHNAKKIFETVNSKLMTPTQVESARNIWSRIKIEVLISKEVDKGKIVSRVEELTKGLPSVPWFVLTEDDIRARVDEEYNKIGEI